MFNIIPKINDVSSVIVRKGKEGRVLERYRKVYLSQKPHGINTMLPR